MLTSWRVLHPENIMRETWAPVFPILLGILWFYSRSLVWTRNCVSTIPRRQHLAKKNNPREYFLVAWFGGVVVGLSAKWDSCSTQGTFVPLVLFSGKPETLQVTWTSEIMLHIYWDFTEKSDLPGLCFSLTKKIVEVPLCSTGITE